MKRKWTDDELDMEWALTKSDINVVNEYRTDSSRLGFAILLKWFEKIGRFPQRKQEIPKAVTTFVAKQLDIDPLLLTTYALESRMARRHRQQIRTLFKFREATNEDAEQIHNWLVETQVTAEREMNKLKTAVYATCRERQIEPPSVTRIERLIQSAVHEVDTVLFAQTMERLPATCRERLDNLLKTDTVSEGDSRDTATEDTATLSNEESKEITAGYSALHRLRQGAGAVKVETLKTEMEKVKALNAIGLPKTLFAEMSPTLLNSYQERVAAEAVYELRRHPPAIRYTLLAAWCWKRRETMIDTAVDLLIELIHRLRVRAERRVEKTVLHEVKQVKNKGQLLYEIAEAALSDPAGTIEHVIHPVADEKRLQQVVTAYKTKGTYQTQVRMKMRGSYQSHYRQMMPPILNGLTFRTDNVQYHPLLKALQLFKAYVGKKCHSYPLDETVILDGVVPEKWRSFVVQEGRVNRLNYELSVLRLLREGLRTRAVWVAYADRYRNPSEDVPADFGEKRPMYYAVLSLPTEGEKFIEQEKAALQDALRLFNNGLKRNAHVELETRRGRSSIRVEPLEPVMPTVHLRQLKTAVKQAWPVTSLLDVLKECDLRLNITSLFKTATSHTILPHPVLQKRLLLCLYALGANIELSRIAAGNDVSERELRYVQRRFISRGGLRLAIGAVADGTFAVRQPEWWGEIGTACASDSKKFGAWDQNILTEWHVRYRGPGVMVYWHVEKKSVCIYSQLKRCSSSEAAAMLEGVLRHCTDMEVTKQYVDTHGQSEVAFAFSHLLGFQLMPRLKGINRKKLYVPDVDTAATLPQLTPILITKPIQWNLIAEQYDEMVKYTTALRLGTAHAEAILHRFTRAPILHPTYRALQQLGRVRRTIFLCHYLHDIAIRREIQAGLNVIEQWNGANTFIFFGRNSELRSNNLAQQELSVLALHLLQNCLVYINTMMLQRILNQPTWRDRLTETDRRGLTPLFYQHINPYGTFQLDMDSRLALEVASDASNGLQ